MTTQQHPITPPPELVQQWRKSGPADAAVNNAYERHIAHQAARWGADQELEACCEWFAADVVSEVVSVVAELRTARRPKPPSLKEQALEVLSSIERIAAAPVPTSKESLALIRQALEALIDE